MAALLDTLTPDQQRLVDLTAEAFALDNEWPIFDYLEGAFDQEQKDAVATLASFPRVGRWGYSCVWWVGQGQTSGLASGQEVSLTVVGMHHTKTLQPLVDLYFDVIGLMVSRRRSTPLERRKRRDLVITDEDVKDLLGEERRLDTGKWPLFMYKLIEREPMMFGGGASQSPDGHHWTRVIPREVDGYDGVRTIDDYVSRLERLTAFPQEPVLPAAPSPLDLVAALDYLDTAWRVGRTGHLFSYPSAERAAKLAYNANTSDEFDSRLSALGEILRSANRSARSASAGKLAASTFDDPLAPLENYLVQTVDTSAETRVRHAVTALEHALAIRDAAQHAEAGDRAVRALDAFGIGHPIADPGLAWSIITAHVVEALSAIREELASLSN